MNGWVILRTRDRLTFQVEVTFIGEMPTMIKRAMSPRPTSLSEHSVSATEFRRYELTSETIAGFPVYEEEARAEDWEVDHER